MFRTRFLLGGAALCSFVGVQWGTALAWGKAEGDHSTCPMELVFVEMISRHGYRTPLSPIVPGDNTEWHCETEHLALLMNSAEDYRDGEISMGSLYRLRTIRSPRDPMRAIKGTCYEGQLTAAGRQQMAEVGQSLRNTYVQQGEQEADPFTQARRFLPEHLDTDKIYIRATSYTRTLETAQCLMDAMYPLNKRPNSPSGILTIHTLPKNEENMYGSSSCKRYATKRLVIVEQLTHCPLPRRMNSLAMLRKASLSSELYLSSMEQYSPLRTAFKKVFDTKHLRSWPSLNNTFSCMQGMGFALPPGVTEEMLEQVAEAAGKETYQQFASKEICMLSIGRFVGDLLRMLEDVAEERSHIQMVYFSGHDNTLSPLLIGFDMYSGRHPPMGSVLVFELWRNKYTKKYYVHARFNGEEKLLYGEKFCPLERFVQLAREEMVPKDYQKQCLEV